MIRILISISLLLMCFFSYSQNKVIDFVDENMGKKVKHGVCYDLVSEANGGGREFNKQWGDKKKYKVKEPKIGDAIYFDGVIYYDDDGNKGRAISHIGIVYKVIGNGRIVIAHQNVDVCRGNTSKVVLTGMNYKMIEKGKIKFYRFPI